MERQRLAGVGVFIAVLPTLLLPVLAKAQPVFEVVRQFRPPPYRISVGSVRRSWRI